jgi:uncharacterized damage-inducible protein DinB
MKEHFLQLYEYGSWANRRAIEMLKKYSQGNERARRLLNHVLSAEQIWITRLRGQDSSALPVWPERSLDECAILAQQNLAEYREFVANLTEAELSGVVTYKNSAGQRFQSSIRDILTHVANHGTHHRAQIAIVIRDGGDEPVNTDFITFVREAG